MKKLIATFVLAACVGSVYGAKTAEGPELPFPANCTTTEKIQFLRRMNVPENMGLEATRDAVLIALGKSTSDPNWAQQNLKGQWYYEYSTEDIVYAGLTIRGHYLRLAIHYDEEVVSTIICDSVNLDQSKNSIHRKVPLWKQPLDSRIGMELGKSSEAIRVAGPKVSRELADLQNLHQKGIITDVQFAEAKDRIEAAE
jgi:hypothetical protein